MDTLAIYGYIWYLWIHLWGSIYGSRTCALPHSRHPETWMGELAIVHARGLARYLNSRAARCVYETAVRNGKARGHKLPPSLHEIDEFYPPGDCWMGTSSSHRAD